MTKAVFSLPHSSLMFSVDKLFVSETKPGEIRLLLKSSVGSSVSRFYIVVFSFHTALRLIGIKWLVKLCKHMLPYRSHPCINSECVCVCFQVCLCLFMLAWQCCTCTGVWSHYESETMGQDSSAHSAHLHQCALTSVCVFVSVCVCICIYITLCMPTCVVCLWSCVFIFMHVHIYACGSECIYIL